MNFEILAVIALVMVEMAIAGGCALLYSRMRSKADSEKASMIPWGIEVKAAVGTANDAKRAVELLELEHYKSLRSMFEDQALQIANLKADNVKLLQRVESLELKVATLQRMDRAARKKEADAILAEEAAPALPGSELNGVPFPEGASPEPRARSFGRIH